jgi:NTP pyrophosphatase (non-canonical NTP hydrolase)
MSEYATLRAANVAREAERDPSCLVTALYRSTELGGEVGEALNIVKKLERQRLGLAGSRATVADLADELGDVIIAADLLAMRYCINLDAAIRSKFNETSRNLKLTTMMQTKDATK